MSEISAIPAPETSPSAIPPTPTPPSKPNLEIIRSWLPIYLSKTDRKLSQLGQILSTPGGTDTLLLTICYTSLLTSSILTSLSLARLRATARQIIEKAISLPPDTTLIFTASSTINPSKLLITAQRLKALSSLISDVRIFARLWGLLSIYKWGKGVVLSPVKTDEKGNEDRVGKGIEYAQVLVNVFYQYLENGAYLSSKGVLGWDTRKQNKAWAWSSRFWMAHVGLDFWRLYREWIKSSGKEEGEWKETWRRQMLVNLAFAPLTVHWSLEEGLVSEFWVGLLGSVAGWTGLRWKWKMAGEV